MYALDGGRLAPRQENTISAVEATHTAVQSSATSSDGIAPTWAFIVVVVVFTVVFILSIGTWGVKQSRRRAVSAPPSSQSPQQTFDMEFSDIEKPKAAFYSAFSFPSSHTAADWAPQARAHRGVRVDGTIFVLESELVASPPPPYHSTGR